MPRSELYHVCIVVPDLVGAREHLTELLGLEWGPVVQFDLPYRTADGTDAVVAGFQMCYSMNGPHLELVAEQPGTPWVCNEHSNLHHIGFLVDDVEAGAGHMARSACPLEIFQRLEEAGSLAWAYLRDRLGFRIEIVDAAGTALMGELMLGGKRQFDVPLTAPF